MKKGKNIFKRCLSVFLSFMIVLSIIPFAPIKAVAAGEDLPVLDNLDKYGADSATAIKTLSNIMNASGNATNITALLKRGGGYAALFGSSVSAIRGAVEAYDKNDKWYENIWNIGSGAIAGFLGLDAFTSSSAVRYDLAEMTALIKDIDRDIQEINSKIEDLEASMQTNFEQLSNQILNKIEETEYKQFLNEFTQVNDRNAFSYYSFFKPDLEQRYNELLVALEGGNTTNIKQAYDNLYLVAKQSEQLYYYVSGESTILTGKQSIQDMLYDYAVLSGQEDFELTCVEFAEDVHSTFIFAQYCLSLCYNYQLLSAQMNEQPYDAYYSVKLGETTVETIQYSSISSKTTTLLQRQHYVTKNIAKYICKVLRLNGEFDYASHDIRFGSVPYSEVSNTSIYNGVEHKTLEGATVYYRQNNKLQVGDVIQICEMPDLCLGMFDPNGFTVSLSNENAQFLPDGRVKATGGAFDVIYSYDDLECYRVSFSTTKIYSGGLGIAQAPYLVSTTSDFYGLRGLGTQCYYLMINDIDFNKSQLPLIGASYAFGGVLDGGGYKVYNYEISSVGTNGNDLINNALFPAIKSGAIIKNLTIGNASCSSFEGYSVNYRCFYNAGGTSFTAYNGILSGINDGTISNCNIENVKVNANVQVGTNGTQNWSMSAYVGGFAAENRGIITRSTISNCNIAGQYQSNQAPCELSIGGIVGSNRGRITNCFALSNVLSGQTIAAAVIVSPTSIIHGGHVIGRVGGSYNDIYYENCDLTMTPQGNGQNQRINGINGSSLCTYPPDSSILEERGWKIREDGRAVIDNDWAKFMSDFVAPYKTVYYQGEALNLTGLELCYGNRMKEDYPEVPSKYRAYGFTVSGYDPDTVGTQTVTISYGNLSVSYDVTVLCPHQWENGTETTPPSHMEYGVYTETCSICGETKGIALNKLLQHEFPSWTSYDEEQHQRVCACGAVEKEAHHWDNGTVTTPATHTQVGEMTYQCSDCKETKTEEISKLSTHTYGSWASLNDDQHQKVCACGDTVKENHLWDSGVVTTPATHTTVGKMTHQCVHCEATKIADIPKLPTHTYGNWASIGDDQHQKVCACGDTVKENHLWDGGEITAPATHVSDGIMTYTCDDCGATYTEIIPKLSVPADAVAITVDEVRGIIGQTIKVDVNLVNNPGVTSVRVTLHYNSELLKLTNISYNSAMGGQWVAPEDYEVLDGTVVLYWTNGFNDYAEDGIFATLTFEAGKNTTLGEQTEIGITYETDDIYNANEENVAFVAKSGSITFINYLPGDINGDGVVNTKDTTRLMRYFAGWDVEVVEAALDVNGDGVVNTKDTTRLMRYLAGWDVDIY